MFTTPERSETMPPNAPNTSGVANRSIAAASADHTTTASRLPSPDFVDATAPIPPSTPATTAPQPSRRSPSRTVHSPSATAATAITIEGAGVRTSSGGSASHQAKTPSATPLQPAHTARLAVPRSRRRPSAAVM